MRGETAHAVAGKRLKLGKEEARKVGYSHGALIDQCLPVSPSN